MLGHVKRVLLGAEVAVGLIGAGLAADEPAAATRVLRSDDGKLIMICYFEPRRGMLSFCDAYYYPSDHGRASGSLAISPAESTRV